MEFLAQHFEVTSGYLRSPSPKPSKTPPFQDVEAHFQQFGSTTDVYLPFIPGRPGHKAGHPWVYGLHVIAKSVMF
jgi:hypothetical protein